jgi:hypothetical protein
VCECGMSVSECADADCLGKHHSCSYIVTRCPAADTLLLLLLLLLPLLLSGDWAHLVAAPWSTFCPVAGWSLLVQLSV